MGWEYERRLEARIEDLEDEIMRCDATASELDKIIGAADKALKRAWELLGHDERILLLENEYAEEFFWNEPERIERDGK